MSFVSLTRHPGGEQGFGPARVLYKAKCTNNAPNGEKIYIGGEPLIPTNARVFKELNRFPISTNCVIFPAVSYH